MPGTDTRSHLDYCAGLSRRADYDRYLCAATAPRAARADLLTVLAFNHEIAKTREMVSEPMLGQIRLQWWREAVEGVYAGTPREHPVVEALAGLVDRKAPDRALLDSMIDAREYDLEDRPPTTMTELELYARNTSGTLMQLWDGVLGAGPGADGERIGTAWALVGLLRAAPYHARQNRRYIPDDLMAEVGLTEQSYHSMAYEPAFAAAARGIADHAQSILPRKSSTAPGRAMLSLCDLFLRRLARSEYDAAAAEPGRLRKQIRVLTGL